MTATRTTRSKTTTKARGKPGIGKTRVQQSRRKSGTETGKDVINGHDQHSESDNLTSEDDAYKEPESDGENTDANDGQSDLDSDALDDDFDEKPRKRKRNSPRKSTKSSPAKSTPQKKKKHKGDSEDEDSADGDLEIVGEVVQAPTRGRVPPGQISQNTLNFLKNLQDPECNDRTWFKLHEPVYRLAEKEWKGFVEEFTPLLIEADSEIPPLPPKDVIHRIYRDIRFSNDKTPYKTGFSASFSRSGRKGIFACYHVAIKAGGSFVAAGTWCAGKNELQTLRNNILHDPAPLRNIISGSEFERIFGEAKPHPKGERQNIFGHEDELKTAPKGIDKNHKDIDLLRCRSFSVIHRFLDSEVLDPNFKHTLKNMIELLRPFVHCLNDMMTLPPDETDGSDED